MVELNKDKYEERKKVILSKIKTYLRIDDPPLMDSEPNFLASLGTPLNENERIDANLLFCVYRDAVDLLVTEDTRLRKKSVKIGLGHRVLSVKQCLEFCKRQVEDTNIIAPPSIRLIPCHNIDIKERIFDSLRADYPEFDAWWRTISREGAKCVGV